MPGTFSVMPGTLKLKYIPANHMFFSCESNYSIFKIRFCSYQLRLTYWINDTYTYTCILSWTCWKKTNGSISSMLQISHIERFSYICVLVLIIQMKITVFTNQTAYNFKINLHNICLHITWNSVHCRPPIECREQ